MGVNDTGGLTDRLFCDIAGTGQSPLGHHGAKDLVDQHAKQDDEGNSK